MWHLSKFALAIAATCVCSSAAHAAGFALANQSASGTGNAFAGGAAAAEDDGGEEADDSEAEDELKRFRRWYKKRIGADVDLFESVKLAKSAKLLVADEVLRMSWETYP